MTNARISSINWSLENWLLVIGFSFFAALLAFDQFLFFLQLNAAADGTFVFHGFLPGGEFAFRVTGTPVKDFSALGAFFHDVTAALGAFHFQRVG